MKKNYLFVVLLCFYSFIVSIALAGDTPEKFVKDYSGISWTAIIALIAIIGGLLRLIWWLCVEAIRDMKKTNHDTVEELKKSNKENVERLERSIDKLDTTISKVFARIDNIDDNLSETNERVSKVEGICIERRQNGKGC